MITFAPRSTVVIIHCEVLIKIDMNKDFKEFFSCRFLKRSELSITEETTVKQPEITRKYKNDNSDESIIASDLVITGSIVAQGNITIYGTVHGDITSRGDVVLYGQIDGNVSGDSITIIGATVNGDVEASGQVSIFENSIVHGGVKSSNADISGEVKGNVHSSQEVVLRSKSSIQGNIETSSISVAQGAIIVGQLKITKL